VKLYFKDNVKHTVSKINQEMAAVTFEVFTANIHVQVFGVLKPNSIVTGYQHFGGSKVLQNVGNLSQHCTLSQPRRPRLEL